MIDGRGRHLSPQVDQDATQGRHAMKKFLLASTALVALALALGLTAPASAADLAARPYTKAPPVPVVAIYDWTGFYIGANGGGGRGPKFCGLPKLPGPLP